MNYYDIVGADAPAPAALVGPAAEASDPLADVVAKRVPKAELEKLQQSLTPLLKISLSDPVATTKSMIAMNEKTVEFMLKFCKTPEERKAVVKASLKQFEGADKDPSTSPEVKKLFKDSAERLNKLAGIEAQSFWTRPVLGPVPGWGVAAGGAGILGVLAMLMFRRR